MTDCHAHDSIKETALRSAGEQEENELIEADDDTLYLFENNDQTDHYTVWEREGTSDTFIQVDSTSDPHNK